MAERKFEYEAIAEIYKSMQTITGDSSSSDSIAGILHNINEDVHNSVGVCEESVYGDLGNQLLLDWDNTSSNFDNFVANFNNWSTVVAQAAGDYSKFEEGVKGFKEANPLGVTSGGIKDAYTNTSFYHNYKTTNSQQYQNDMDELKSLHAITGVEYACADSESLLKRHQLAAKIMLAGDIVSLITIAWSSLGGAASSSGGVPAANPTTPALPGPVAGGTPALPGTVAQPISAVTEHVALTSGVNPVAQTSILNALSQAEQAGAAFAQPGTNCILEFLDSAGKVIGMLTESGFVLV